MPTATGSAHQGSSEKSQGDGSYEGAAAAQAEPPPRAVQDTSTDIEELFLWKIAEKLNAQQSKMVGIKLGMQQTQLENLQAKVRWNVSSQEEMNFEMLHKWHANQTPDDDPGGTLRRILATDLTLSAEMMDELFKEESFTYKSTRERLLGPQQLYEIAQRVNKTQHIPLVLRLGFTFNELLNCNIHEADQRLYEMIRRWQKNLPRAMDQIGIMSDILSASGHRGLAHHIRNNHWNRLVGERGSSLIWEPERNDIPGTFRVLDLNITIDNPEVHRRMDRILENCTPIPEHLNQPEGSTQEKTKSVYDQCRQTSEYLTELQGAIKKDKMYETIGFTVSSIVLHIRVYSEEGLQKLQEDIRSGDLSRRLAQVITPETSASLPDHAVPHVTLSPGTFHLVSQQTTGRAVVSPELKQKLTEAGLDADYWTSILESRLEINLPQGIQNLDEIHLKDLEPHITQDWEKEALMKLLGIKSGPASPKAEKEGESPIVSKFFEAGLDGEYWANVLKSKLGITKYEQIANLNINDFKELEADVRYEWEENALRKLFCINDEANEDFMKKHQKRHKERHEETQNLLREVGDMRKAGIQRTKEMMGSKLERLRELLSIPKNEWIEGYDDERFHDMIDKMSSEVQGLVNREPVKNMEGILENASGGLALKGVLVGEAFQDCCIKRVALSTPTDAVLTNPAMQPVDNVASFSSKTQSDHFHESLDTMGYSFANSVQGGRGFESESRFSRETEEQEVTSELYTQTHLESRVKYSVIPTASCELNPHSLKLSKQALQELMAIDIILEGSKNVDPVYKKCEDFLSAYGSHINAGVLHFGGVYTFVGTYSSETNSITDQIKLMVRDALDTYASIGYSCPGFSVGGLVSADQLGTLGSGANNYEKSELAKISLQTQRIGGPPEVSVLALWKMGLVTCNSTWALIDRGKSLLGIWNLVSNHRDEFQNPYELESTLMSVWEKMSGYTGSSDQQRRFKPELYAIVQLIEKISRWNSDPILPKMCIGYLHEIQEAISEVGSNKYWVDKLCTEEKVSSFLQKIVDLRNKFDPKDVSEIQLLIRILVNPIGFRKFPGKENIIKFAYAPFILDIASINGISDLITNLKEILKNDLQIRNAKNVENSEYVSDRINAGTTHEMMLCVGQLLKELQSSKRTHELFFLKVALLSLDYHWPTQTFGTTVTIEKLEDFAQSIEVSWNEFQDYKKKGQIQLEGFLIHNLLNAGHFNEGIKSSENEFCELVKELRQATLFEITTVLNRYATKSPFKWSDMRKVFAELAKGNEIAVLEEIGVYIPDLEEMAHFQTQNKNDDASIKSGDSVIPTEGKFREILDFLGLSGYYPSKISVLEATAIKIPIRQPKLTDIPWLILKKLFMIDFRARDQPFQDAMKSPIHDESDNTDEYDFDTLLEFNNISSLGENQTGISTLDAFVTLFVCCDNFLKQIVAEKLFVCKLAIPFLYPLGSEGKLGMSLWALRTIIVQSSNQNEKPSETPVANGSFPLVTFIRLGRPPMSKSKLLNNVLRDDSHDTFFHGNCYNGTEARVITDGLVECSWFIPGGRGFEHLPQTTMILNLRGDALLLQKQFDILQEMSTVMFFMVTAQDLAKNYNSETCKNLLKKGAKVIMYLITSDGTKHIQELRSCCDAAEENILKRVPMILSYTKKGIRKNDSDIKTEARRKLSDALNGCSNIVLEESAQVAMNMGTIIDEYDDEACIEGKKLAEKAYNNLSDKEIEKCRELLLPLQGTEWIEYSKLLKEQHRASKKAPRESPADYAEKVKQMMDRLREKQVKMCKGGLSPFIRDFISGLQMKQPVDMYFLKWVSLFLDEKSRSTLPGIRTEYYNSWVTFHDAKKDRDKESIEYLRKQVDNAEQRLANASLGLEHLFRELGQVYEAIMEGGKIGKGTKLGAEYLVGIAANLLLNGIPLELVDGDAASVPSTWVCAVLKKVENLIGEKRLYVISVLGIQSSGKSTLLNTMFGLQFAVGAGRCTKGAYMQLIPVDEKAGLSFDYVVVVDTEGLRATELGKYTHRHDNELATLVIGLGDVTLINIKGENTAEIKDILQIAVHAFLRMNLVKRQTIDNRTCVFIHQNVPAANASELMQHGCQKLKENLDYMTNEAAQNEGIADIQSFSQIINFDIKKHVWYFSDLWHGNPPMAPANPGYSGQVNEVQLNLLEKIAEEKKFLTASELSTRLDDLWKGVLADDFVFSFRNSLEVKAYNILQSEYYAMEWEMQDEGKSWSKDAEIELRRCGTIDDLESSYNSLLVNLPKVLSTKAKETKDSLLTYFEKCDLRDIIIQWQQSKLNQLEFATEELHQECKKDLKSIKESRRFEILHARESSKNRDHIMSKAIELADQLKGKEASDDELERKFNDMWTPMVNDLATQTEDEVLKIDVEMEIILTQMFHNHLSKLQAELKLHPLYSPPEHTSIENSITADFVRKEHISLKATLLEKLKNFVVRMSPEEDARNETMVLTRNILKEIGRDLKGLSHEMKFQKHSAKDIIRKLLDRINSYNSKANASEHCNFTILPDYIVKLAVHVSRYCVQVFSLMQLQYINEHGVKAKLRSYKNAAWSLFTNKVKEATEEVVAGDLLCAHLEETVQKAINKAALRNCTGEILRDFQMSKYYMLVKIMDDLAVKGNFYDYLLFLKNAKEFALKWLHQYTDKKMFSRQNASASSRYAEITKSHIVDIMQCITKSVSNATSEVEGQEGMKMALWIEKFCDGISEKIAVPVGDLSLVSERSVTNFNNLQRVVLDKLKKFQAVLENTFSNKSPITVEWYGSTPPQQVLDKIWGCPEICPFCQEPCADTTPNHFKSSGKAHMCVQHRPNGIIGIRWDGDGEFDGDYCMDNQLIHHCCNHFVQSNSWFRCSLCKYKCRDSGKCYTTGTGIVFHKYVEYKTFLPDWDIAPDRTNSVSKYWMWFMTTYQHQLKDHYLVKLPNLPPSWASVTRDEALKDLRKIHH